MTEIHCPECGAGETYFQPLRPTNMAYCDSCGYSGPYLDK